MTDYHCAMGCDICMPGRHSRRAFCDEHGITVAQFYEKRALAVAKMHEPRTLRIEFRVVENPEPDHILRWLEARPTARLWLHRYLDSWITDALVEFIVSMRKRAALHRWTMTLPTPLTDEVIEDGHLLAIELDGQAEQWRAELRERWGYEDIAALIKEERAAVKAERLTSDVASR